MKSLTKDFNIKIVTECATFFHFYEPERKLGNKICLSKNPSIAKREKQQ